LLHSKSQFCAAPTRALLLSTYIKWVNVFPEIKVPLVSVFERYRHVMDVDLQQRACEFYALASRPENDDLLQNVCEEMPPFPARQSALLGRLNRKVGDTQDQRTWIDGGKEANEIPKLAKPAAAAAASPSATTNPSDIMGALAGLDLSTPSATPEAFIASNGQRTPSSIVASGPNVDRWFEKLGYNSDGVLYEDVQIQIGVKSRFQGHLGQLAIYIGNKVAAPMTSVTTTVQSSDSDAITISFAKMPPSTIAPRTQAQLQLQVECKKPFSVPPTLTVSFLAGSHQDVTLRLPVVLTKFMEHVKLEQDQFFERWRLIGGPPREVQSVFPIKLTDAGSLDLTKQHKVVSGHHFNVLEGVDPNPSNIVGAAVLHTSVDGKVGCLLRVEPNKDAKVRASFVHVACVVLNGHLTLSSPVSLCVVPPKSLLSRCKSYLRHRFMSTPYRDWSRQSYMLCTRYRLHFRMPM
jgi:AP-2 complex subunit alpha